MENEKNELDVPLCMYNVGVVCSPNNRCCANCGWNPEVAMERLENLRNGRTAQGNAKKHQKNS